MLQLLTKKSRGLALRNSKGFTLIELLVVIAIIGILSSIVLVSMGGARKSARDAVRKADMRQITSAQEMHSGINSGEYFSAAGPTMPAGIPTYMPKFPVDPTNTGTQIYGWVTNDTDTTTKQSFCAYAILETPATPTTYYTASHAGNFTCSDAPPTLDDCCF